jgi:hypothetical protein
LNRPNNDLNEIRVSEVSPENNDDLIVRNINEPISDDIENISLQSNLENINLNEPVVRIRKPKRNRKRKSRKNRKLVQTNDGELLLVQDNSDMNSIANNESPLIDGNSITIVESNNGDSVVLNEEVIDSVQLVQTVNANDDSVTDGNNEAVSLIIDDTVSSMPVADELMQADGSVSIRKPKRNRKRKSRKNRRNRKLVQTNDGELLLVQDNSDMNSIASNESPLIDGNSISKANEE